MAEDFKVENSSFSCDLSLSLSSLLASSTLCDVTLVCEDGHLLAHKVILAATSSFFNSVFKLNHHNHPLIYLRGIKIDQMKAVLDFLYSGVVNVTEEGVEEFIEVANDLQIEGLMVQYKKKRKRNKKSSNEGEKDEKKNEIFKEKSIDLTDELPEDVQLNLINQNIKETLPDAQELEKTNTEPESKKPKRKYTKRVKKIETEFEYLPSEQEDVEINLINQKIKETLPDAQELEMTLKEVGIKKPKRKYTKKAKKTETDTEVAEKMKRKEANAASQNSLPRLIFPQSHTSTNLTSMVPKTIPCPVCNTRVVASLKSHMESHRYVACQDCNEIFDSCNSLHHHKKGNCLTQNIRGHLDF